jgi:hypothetical protein
MDWMTTPVLWWQYVMLMLASFAYGLASYQIKKRRK